MNYKYYLFSIIISLFTHASFATGKCQSFTEYIEVNNKQELYRAENYCLFLIAVGNYRTHFVKQYGNEAWGSLKWLKDNPNEKGGISLSVLDWDIDEY